MKITCTERERRAMIKILADNIDLCAFEKDFGDCYGLSHCEKCITEHIEWILEDGDGK